MPLIELSDDTFDTVTKTAGVTVVDFWAPWCGPCKPMKAMLEELATEGVKVCSVDVQDYPGVGSQYGIRALPTLLFFKDGNPVQTMVGASTKAAILDAIKNL